MMTCKECIHYDVCEALEKKWDKQNLSVTV